MTMESRWRFTALALLLAPALAWTPPAAAGAPAPAGAVAAVNGQVVVLAGAERVAGTTFVPVRDACRELACSVQYRAGTVVVTAGSQAAGPRQLAIDLATRSLPVPAGGRRARIRLRHGRTYVPLRAFVEGLGGRVAWLPGRSVQVHVLAPWLIQADLALLREELAKSRSDGEAIARIVRRSSWPWLLYVQGVRPWYGQAIADVLEAHAFFFWGEDRRRFLARVLDVPFRLDRRPYETAAPQLDLLLYVGLAAATSLEGSELRWVASLAPGREGGIPSELAPYLGGLGVADERGERPAVGADVRAYVPGPGSWLPLRR